MGVLRGRFRAISKRPRRIAAMVHSLIRLPEIHQEPAALRMESALDGDLRRFVRGLNAGLTRPLTQGLSLCLVCDAEWTYPIIGEDVARQNVQAVVRDPFPSLTGPRPSIDRLTRRDGGALPVADHASLFPGYPACGLKQHVP
jgi:hypothetical protein